MDKSKARFTHRQRRRSLSRARGTRESTSTTRATKRDRSRTGRRPLSPRINQFARQLERRHSAGSTARKRNSPRGATTEPAAQPAMSNPDVARPSAAPQLRECREQSVTSVTRGPTPSRRIDKRKKTCEVCCEIMYTRNWIRHLERCHVNAGTELPSGTTGEREPRIVATATQGSNRRSRIDTVCAKSAIRRCVSLVYPLECLNVPLSVQMSCAKKRIVGMSSHDRWMCVNSVNVLVSKMRSEMSMALPLMETRHFARSRSMSSQQDPEAASEIGEHIQTGPHVHSGTVFLDDASQVAETASLLSTVEHGELMQSVITRVELPHLSGEEVEMNLDTDVTLVKERVIPLDVLKERYLVKQATKPPALQLASCTSSEDQLVEHSRGGNTQDQQSAVGAVTSSPLITGATKSNQLVQSCATIVQHIPEPNLVASQKAASPAAHTEARQDHGEKRGSPRPRPMSRSTRSRSPVRERYGYPRRDARWENRSRSPRRMEHRVTPRPSPGRRLPLERGRGESRRDDRYDRDREPTSDEGMKRWLEAFFNFMHRSRD